MEVNKNYWEKELKPPYSPSDDDFYIYKNNLLAGTTLLLGCTHKLIKISNVQLDIDPWYKANTVITGNWIDNKDFYKNIIGDGVFNFTKDLTDKTLLMCSNYCERLIVRLFNKKLPNMKVASYFPEKKDFIIIPNETIFFNDYFFCIWDFAKRN